MIPVLSRLTIEPELALEPRFNSETKNYTAQVSRGDTLTITAAKLRANHFWGQLGGGTTVYAGDVIYTFKLGGTQQYTSTQNFPITMANRQVAEQTFTIDTTKTKTVQNPSGSGEITLSASSAKLTMYLAGGELDIENVAQYTVLVNLTD